MPARPGKEEARIAAEVEHAVGHGFADRRLLREALTHSSATVTGRRRQTRRHRSNERLEFLGDRVLGLVVADLLMAAYPEEPEGALTHRHDALVRRETLAEVAAEIGLGRWLSLARGEEEGGGRANPAILANSCEALIGAVYLDGGLAAARAFIERHWAGRIEAVRTPPRDAKTALQEWAQARGLDRPGYAVVQSSGPAHAPMFTVEVSLGERGQETALAKSKRAAEQAAAERLLERLKEGSDDGRPGRG